MCVHILVKARCWSVWFLLLVFALNLRQSHNEYGAQQFGKTADQTSRDGGTLPLSPQKQNERCILLHLTFDVGSVNLNSGPNAFGGHFIMNHSTHLPGSLLKFQVCIVY